MRRSTILALAWLASACAAPATDPVADEDPRPALSFTHWTERTELFVELRAPVVGEESPCAAHVTVLEGFRPPAEGTVTAVLSGGGADERFPIAAPSVPGIFRPVLVPRAAGVRQLRFEIELGGTTDVHELGEVRVYASVDEAVAGVPPEEPQAARITFLKEQQWPIPFATAVVAEGELQPTLAVPAEVRARPEGEAWIAAPAAGRVVAPDAGFPVLGARVELDGLLARLAPQLEGGADRASLDLARTSSRIEVEQATRERERLEALVTAGAVPERRLIDARHAEAEARAALVASQRRLGQYHGVQRAGGRGGAALEVRAPIAGVIAEIAVAPGAFVAADDRLFHVVDASSLWLEIRVPEIDAAALDPTRGGWVGAPGGALALPPDAFVARAPIVDPRTRTQSVVYELRGAEGALAPGAFVTAHLARGEPVRGLVVPASALVDEGTATVAFVQVEGEAFERRVVRIAAREGERAAIAQGLGAGEHVVTIGAYAIRLAMASGSVPAHGHAH